MKNKNFDKEENPWIRANFISRLTFWWLLPLMRKGLKKPLENEDLFKIQENEQSNILVGRLSKRWDQELSNLKTKRKKTSLLRAICKTFWFEMFYAGVFSVTEECIIRIGQPVCLGYLVKYFLLDSKEDSLGWLYSFGIVGFGYFYVVSHHIYFYSVMHLGMRLRIASCGLIYRKAIRLSKSSMGKTTIGQMVNLLSNDVNRFDQASLFLHYLWVGPLQAILVTGILWTELGPSCLAGVAVLIIFVPLQTLMGKIFSRLRFKTAQRTDNRIRLMNEIISAMRVIKMYAWEIPFTKMLELARNSEVSVIMKTNYFRAFNMSLFFTSSKLIVFLSLLTYVLSGNILTAEKVFLTSALINSVRLSMTLFFPYAIAWGAESLISVKRIQKFLLMDEKPGNDRNEIESMRPLKKDCRLECKGIKARWEGNAENTISDISFSVKSGEMLAIIGAIGSGKSSILQAILEELSLLEGSIDIKGKIAYVSQEAWLFSGTLRENILFGQKYDHKKYQKVLAACSLEKDLKMFPDGDFTTVGERGVSLSGGQKARINLARAVYFDADIYLLDDPLSAVDAHVGKRLYEDCLMGILENNIRILVTHQIQYLSNASQILVLSEGREKALGSYKCLTAEGVDFSIHMQENEDVGNSKTDSRRPSIRTMKLLNKVAELRVQGEVLALTASDQSIQTISDYSGVESWPPMNEIDINTKAVKESSKELPVMPVETKQSGSISRAVYMGYFNAGGGPCFNFILLVISIIAQILYSGTDVWLSYWTNQEQREASMKIDDNFFLQPLNGSGTLNLTNYQYEEETFNLERETYVYIYAGMTASLFILSFVRTIQFYIMCITASRVLHNSMLQSLLRAPIRFFDNHPIGIILNRFSKDMGQIDDLLPQSLYDFLEILLVVVAIIIIIATINPWILIPTLILTVVFCFIRIIYLSSAREIKRLEGLTRSPVFSHLSTSLHGLTTIRAFKAENQLINIFDNYQDVHSTAWFLFLCTTRWLGIYLDILTNIYLTVVTFSFMRSNDHLGGDVGLAISTAMQLTGMFQWGVRQSAEVENNMTSVERVIEYSTILPEEDPNVEKENPGNAWPSQGKLSFNKVNLRYKPSDPPVLKNLKFTVKAGKKIGIVGRTGAGKSSLLATLFRLTEADGIIEIDGVDVKNVPLERLRSSISIIPQDPTLFSGTLRYNLDPFSKYEDDNIWRALEEVQLDSAVKETYKGLSMEITEGGGNLSVGQRQLVCLARAVLRQNKILVMDEATANVDQKTDSLIQQTIREKFLDCTVLTIAHRLHTIIDADMVMVMSGGRLIEYEEPYLLLQKPSLFSSLVKETGTASENHLTRVAKQAFHKRYEEINNDINEEKNKEYQPVYQIELDDVEKTRF